VDWALLGAAAIPDILALGGIIYGFGKWSSKIDENIKAMDRLTNSYEKKNGENDNKFDKIDDKLDNHETRLVKLETKADTLATVMSHPV